MNKTPIIIDHMYNCKVTAEDDVEYYVFSNHLYNNNLHFWKNWKCNVGVETLMVDFDSKIYDGVCKNTCLGDLSNNTFKLPTAPTTCKQTKCTACTTDLAVTKTKPIM